VSRRTHWHVFEGFAGCLPESRESHWSFKDAMASARSKRAERVADGESWPGWGRLRARDGGDTIYISSPTRTDYIEVTVCTDAECDPDHCGDDY
jgi:hypothetical protein